MPPRATCNVTITIPPSIRTNRPSRERVEEISTPSDQVPAEVAFDGSSGVPSPVSPSLTKVGCHDVVDVIAAEVRWADTTTYYYFADCSV